MCTTHFQPLAAGRRAILDLATGPGARGGGAPSAGDRRNRSPDCLRGLIHWIISKLQYFAAHLSCHRDPRRTLPPLSPWSYKSCSRVCFPASGLFLPPPAIVPPFVSPSTVFGGIFFKKKIFVGVRRYFSSLCGSILEFLSWNFLFQTVPHSNTASFMCALLHCNPGL